MNINEKLQTLLQKKGLYHGEIDGQLGILSVQALYDYFHPSENVPAWMVWAAKELGVSEITGDRHNPRILHYHKYTGLKAQTDEIAWCASFVCAALEEGARLKSTKSAAAASYSTFGTDIKSEGPRFGAIATVETNTGSRRHVFFEIGSYSGFSIGIGGNQSNKVCIKLFSLSAIKERRFPKLS